MAKRMIVMLAVTALFVAGLGFVKFRQIQTAIAQGAAFQPPPEAVTTIVAQQEEWSATLSAIGTVAAVQGVTVSADLPGTVERIAFESGTAVREGDVLALLDTRQEQAQLAAAEAQRDLARLNFERMQGLLERARHLAGRVRPRDRRATARRRARRRNPRGDRPEDDPGAVLRRARDPPGQPGSVPVRRRRAGDAAVAESDLRELRRPAAVVRPDARRPHASASRPTSLPGVEFTGRVTAIDSIVDEATRNIQVQATLANPGGKLRPGMFVQTEVGVGGGSTIVALPASAISYAPFGDSVFVVADLKNPTGRPTAACASSSSSSGAARGDQIAVISGVKPGDEVVTSGVFKLRNGAAVVVNNKVQPTNNPKPKPENS